jgi:hypothetical protein
MPYPNYLLVGADYKSIKMLYNVFISKANTKDADDNEVFTRAANLFAH